MRGGAVWAPPEVVPPPAPLTFVLEDQVSINGDPRKETVNVAGIPLVHLLLFHIQPGGGEEKLARSLKMPSRCP